MRNADPGLLALVLLAAALLAAGMLLVHRARAGMPRALLVIGWTAAAAGIALAAALALAHLAGRLGADQLWFRAPTFYLSAALLAGAATWWFTRPIPARWRLGLPAAAFLLLAGVATVLRLDGRSAPIAMLLPTMDRGAPDFRFESLAGETAALSDFRGRVVLLNFWATWCTPCRREMPLLSKMQREHGAEGLVVVYVSMEEPAVLVKYLAEHRLDGIAARVDGAPDFYDAGKFYPLSFLIARDGHVTQRWSGRPDEAWLGDIIRAQL